jgi:hypothetical protein
MCIGCSVYVRTIYLYVSSYPNALYIKNVRIPIVLQIPSPSALKKKTTRRNILIVLSYTRPTTRLPHSILVLVVQKRDALRGHTHPPTHGRPSADRLFDISRKPLQGQCVFCHLSAATVGAVADVIVAFRSLATVKSF